MDRIYAAQIAYPFLTPTGALDGLQQSFRDTILYISPDDTALEAGDLVVPEPTGIGDVGAWLATVSVTGTDVEVLFYVKFPLDDDYMDTSLDVLPPSGYGYVQRTFLFDATVVQGQIVTIKGDDGRSALVIDAMGLTLPGTVTYTQDNIIEPRCIVPCRRRLRSIALYNEYRAKDPSDRDDIPPDSLQKTIAEGGTLVFNDGFNCSVVYDEDAEILRITGGIGFGKGQPPTNPWDDEEDNDTRGVRTINGVNQGGIVDLQYGNGVLLKGGVGTLDIVVRDQGDDE